MIRAAALSWLAVLACTAGCFDRRSKAFACEREEDCGNGRTCQEGWCVEAAAPTIDADPDAPDADPDAPDADPNAPDAGPFECPPECGSCDETNTCIMNCAGDDSCPTTVVCPMGVKCKVECGGARSCMAGVDCSDASLCRIECMGTDSCAGLVECGAGTCLVECGDTNGNGMNSCALGVDCDQSCQCDTLCDGSGSCAVAPTCPDPPGGQDCTAGDGDCDSTHPDCKTCTG